jgi:hypothetical protein
MALIVSRGVASSSDIAQLLKKQISDLTDDPEKLKQLPHNMTIYHRLMDPKAFRDGTVPSAGSLYEEGQALMFGGGDTVGNTLMVGIHHLLQQPAALRMLKEELSAAWPAISHEPTLSELEQLPYLNAVIKESLRMSSGVVSGLLRVTPSAGVTVNGVAVPPKVYLPSVPQIYVSLLSCRQSYLAAVPSYIIMPPSSQSQPNSVQNAGSSRMSWATGSLLSLEVHACV